eukprot:4867726-Karenia_brevis.AAC.1
MVQVDDMSPSMPQKPPFSGSLSEESLPADSISPSLSALVPAPSSEPVSVPAPSSEPLPAGAPSTLVEDCEQPAKKRRYAGKHGCITIAQKMRVIKDYEAALAAAGKKAWGVKRRFEMDTTTYPGVFAPTYAERHDEVPQ